MKRLTIILFCGLVLGGCKKDSNLHPGCWGGELEDAELFYGTDPVCGGYNIKLENSGNLYSVSRKDIPKEFPRDKNGIEIKVKLKEEEGFTPCFPHAKIQCIEKR